MILNYNRPQLTIADNIEVVTATLANRFQCLIVGPQYRLYRYGVDTMGVGVPFNSAGQPIVLQYLDANGVSQVLPATDVVETTTVKAYVVGGEAILATFDGTGANKFYLSSLATPNILYATAGIYSAAHVILSGAGQIAALDGRPVSVGDIVVVTDGATTRRRTVVALTSSTGSTSVFDQVVLDGPAIDINTLANNQTAVSLAFRIPFTGALTTGVTFNASTQTLTIAAGATAYVPTRSVGNTAVPLANGVGVVQGSYRSLTPPATVTEDMIEITSAADILSLLGPIDVQNDLAFGASEALAGSQGRPIFALRVAGIDAASFAAALAKMESTDQVYAFGIMTSDSAVMDVARDHVAAMCQPDVKNWRRAFVASDSPGSYSVLALNAQGGAYHCTVGGSNAVPLVTATDGADFLVAGVQPGDVATITGVDYTIASVINAQELTLVTPGPAAAANLVLTLRRADNVQSQIDFLTSRANELDSTLVTHIWCENGSRYINGVPTLIPARYIAAQVAGLRSALLPQQGLTHTEISTVTAAPAMYLRYTQANLDTIAANGTFIVTQDNANGDVYIRHQLTTKTDSGSLYYEDSCPTILHYLDFETKDALVGFIGKKNATPQTISQIENVMHDILVAATLTTDQDIGPLIISFANLVVGLHPILKDRIVVSVTVTIPLPLNNIDVTFNAVVSV